MIELDEPISREFAAKLLQINERHVVRLTAEGWIKKNVGDRFTIGGCVHGYINSLKDETRRSSKSAAASKKDDARTREIELRIAQRERTLVSVTEVQDCFDTVWGALRSEVDGLPARMRRNKALREEIQKILDGVLDRSAGRIRDAMRALRAGGATAEASEEDDA